VLKPLEEFHRSAAAKDGRTAWCRPCGTARVRERDRQRRIELGEEAYLAHNREKMRRYRAKPDARERQRAYTRSQQAALWRLAELHRDEFEALMTEERIANGLSVVPYERSTG
jgi:hypothetical protein